MVRWFGYSGGSDEGPAAIFSVTWHQRLSMLPCRAMRYWIIGTALLALTSLTSLVGCSDERVSDGVWLCAQGCPEGLECGCGGLCVEAGTVGLCPPGSQGGTTFPDATLGSLGALLDARLD